MTSEFIWRCWKFYIRRLILLTLQNLFKSFSDDFMLTLSIVIHLNIKDIKALSSTILANTLGEKAVMELIKSVKDRVREEQVGQIQYELWMRLWGIAIPALPVSFTSQ